MNAFADYGGFQTNGIEFGDYQIDLYDNLDKNLFMNDGIITDRLDKSITTIALDEDRINTNDKKISTYSDGSSSPGKPIVAGISMIRDPVYAAEKIDQNMCQNINIPKNIGQRGNALSGCGWYYIEDNLKPSLCMYGTEKGPFIKDNLPIGGTWIWNVQTAQKLEEMKYCRRFRLCEQMNTFSESAIVRCGFCLNKGYAVPILGTNEKYPNEPQSCGGDKLIIDTSKCNTPILPTINTSDGTACGNYGKPSADNSSREYTKAECDKLNGEYMSNGDCISATGQIFNSECKDLNIPVQIYQQNFGTNTQFQSGQPNFGISSFVQSGQPNISAQTGNNFGSDSLCATNTGAVSVYCLEAIARSLGFKKDGGILQMIYDPTMMNDKIISDAIKILRNDGINIPNSVFGNGSIDKESATNIYNTIYSSITLGKTKRIKYAASILVTGDDLGYDICNDPTNEEEGNTLECLQREFRKTGCQASGAAYPNSSNMNMYAKNKKNENIASFKKLYDSIKDTDPIAQSNNINNCLGTNFNAYDKVVQEQRDELELLKSTSKKLITDPISLETYKSRANLVGTIYNATSSYVLSFDLTITGYREWGNICHFTTEQSGNGNKMPAIYLKPGTSKLICFIADTTNRDFNIVTGVLPLNKKVRVTVRCVDDNPTITVDGVGSWSGKQPDKRIDPGNLPVKAFVSNGNPLPAIIGNMIYSVYPEYKGCFNDKEDRAISQKIATGTGTEPMTTSRCALLAMKNQSNTFGIQNGQECWIGLNPDYSKYGKSTNCAANAGPMKQHVYTVKPLFMGSYKKSQGQYIDSRDLIGTDSGNGIRVCHEKCSTDANCVGITYNSHAKTCSRYSSNPRLLSAWTSTAYEKFGFGSISSEKAKLNAEAASLQK